MFTHHTLTGDCRRHVPTTCIAKGMCERTKLIAFLMSLPNARRSRQVQAKSPSHVHICDCVQSSTQVSVQLCLKVVPRVCDTLAHAACPARHELLARGLSRAIFVTEVVRARECDSAKCRICHMRDEVLKALIVTRMISQAANNQALMLSAHVASLATRVPRILFARCSQGMLKR